LRLIWLSAAFIGGVFIGSLWQLPPLCLLAALLPLPLLLLRRYWRRVLLAAFCVLLFCGGALYYQSVLPDDGASYLGYYNDSGEAVIRGIVSRQPDERDTTTQLRLSGLEMQIDGGWRPIQGDVLLFVPRYPQYEYGDFLSVIGEPQTPPVFAGFDYAEYLAREGVYATMLYPQLEVLDTGRGSPLMAWLYSVREDISRTLGAVLPQPQASLAEGMVLGMRGNIPDELREDFSQTGSAHLLAISGLHLSIVAGLALGLGLRLFGRRRYVYVWLALGVVWLYAVITGLHAPVVRAGIMVSVFLAAELLGRQRSSISALLLAAAVMVGVNPQVLFTASFQMSFAAMAGLVFLLPPLHRLGRRIIVDRLDKLPPLRAAAGFLNDGLSVTLAAVLAVWPLVAYYFGIVSLVGPLATLLALPVLPAVIALGIATGGLGFIALPLAQAAGWLLWPFLAWLLLVVEGLAALTLSHIEAGAFIAPFIWVYYVVLIAILWLIHKRRPADEVYIPSSITSHIDTGLLPKISWKWLAVPLVLTIVMLPVVIAAQPDDNLHVTFLDVGQGDAVLISKGNQQVLIDGGPGSQAIALELSRYMPFWDRTIELVVLSHPHDDHVGGLVEVLESYNIEQVLYAGSDSQSAAYTEWLNIVKEKDIAATIAFAGQSIRFDGVVIEVLNPPSPPLTGTDSDEDNNSLVLHAALGEVSFLLTGDIMWPAELELLGNRSIPQCSVLKVAHHGSSTSTSDSFLAVAEPRLAVISVGGDNTYGHPTDEVMQRLAEALGEENIYRTDLDGSIEFITDGENLWLKTAG
jgi:competence protein ComEC